MRRLHKDLINRLATCEYISEQRNLFITSATGSGKTYMAYAFGIETCKRYFNTKYVRLPDLLIDLEITKPEGNYRINITSIDAEHDISMREVYVVDKTLRE